MAGPLLAHHHRNGRLDLTRRLKVGVLIKTQRFPTLGCSAMYLFADAMLPEGAEKTHDDSHAQRKMHGAPVFHHTPLHVTIHILLLCSMFHDNKEGDRQGDEFAWRRVQDGNGQSTETPCAVRPELLPKQLSGIKLKKPMHRRSDDHAHLGNDGISYAGIGRMAGEKEQQHMGTLPTHSSSSLQMALHFLVPFLLCWDLL
ncbi:hypothetical protein EYF80_009507 [Liparis tanakae]|uniref:Uncharacterized protein n=1 Tax=Liparis tanakae TaxID=230148 RepID=A0A4Z2ISC4_9TELE|nr:hypothetical protein EYF80_009507 [Liparis tanakae]